MQTLVVPTKVGSIYVPTVRKGLQCQRESKSRKDLLIETTHLSQSRTEEDIGRSA